MDFIDTMKIKYDDLTTSEKKVGNYILTYSDKFLEQNVQAIAESTKTSGATVIRFCKKIGFESLESMKVSIAMANSQLQEYVEVDPILQKDDSLDVVINKIYSQVDSSLKKTLSMIDLKELSEVVKLIQNSNRIYLVGIGASSLAAYDLYHKLNRINKQAIFNFDGSLSKEFSAHTKQDDVMIAVCYSGETTDNILAVEQAIKNHTPVVAIVKHGKTRLSKMADYCLFVPNNEKRVRMASLGSKFSQLFLMDVLYFCIARDNLDEVLEYLRITSSVGNPLSK